MIDRSIRSFALDYYRKRGADVRPLEGDAETFEIQPAEGPALKVTFADEAPVTAGDRGPTAVTSTSPQWRAILEDLTSDVVVSYRYLASAPIANPARTLAAALPDGWAVTTARLQSVENRVAVGFTHRVTFDSPALNARREVMHHHLWDVQTGERLTAMEPALYQAPTLMIRPDQYPGEAQVKQLLTRSLGLVDADTDERGRTIETELGQLLAEAEARTNQYFEQQMGHVMQREAALSEKLDGVIKRLAEAKSSEAIARYRADGAALQGQLEHMKLTRERLLAEIEAACSRKLEQERERHELLACTDLVAICHASYDVLTYRATVAPPGGEPVELTLRYWPVSKELRLPACALCGATTDVPRALPEGGVACSACGLPCAGCGAPDATGQEPGACTVCATAVCSKCETACATCQTAVCRRHAHVDPGSGTLHCPEHRPAEFALTGAAPGVTAPAAPTSLAVPPSTGVPAAHSSCAGEGPHTHAPLPGPLQPQAGEDSPTGAVQAPDGQVRSAPPCDDPLVAYTQAILGAHDATPEALSATAEATGLPMTFCGPPIAAGPKVVSALSGRQMSARLADTCPACAQHYGVQEMVDCPTCGVPACMRCASGEMGPCPACESLAPTVATDPRLDFVMACYPELERYRRSWEVACVGPYVVTHWSRFGAWGMVVYHRGAAGQTPVVVTEFRYGRLAALRQALSFKRGR